jgi:hypothetical protein
MAVLLLDVTPDAGVMGGFRALQAGLELGEPRARAHAPRGLQHHQANQQEGRHREQKPAGVTPEESQHGLAIPVHHLRVNAGTSRHE